tara:strand:- start:5995 stop:6153 length:159 start_codon:yes stop_codon:yes gene_type:complete
MEKFTRILKILAAVAFFVNIFLLVFASAIDNYDLQILSLVNMILLSFALIRE